MPGYFDGVDLTANELEVARQQQARGGGYIDLTSSNPTSQGLLFPAEVLAAAAAGYWSTRRYSPDPRGAGSARLAICEYYSTRTPALHLNPEQVFITASTSEAYALLFALLCDPGDNMLAPVLSYPLFEYLAALRGVELRPYALREAEGWAIDQPGLLAAADQRTRAVLLISPHNPTGMILQQPLPALEQLGLPLICDEVFAPFHYQAAHTPPVGTLHPQLAVFHLNGISKLLALPDLKLGWIALNAPAEQRFATRLELLNDTLLGANALTQSMLPVLLREGRPFVQHMQAHIRSNLDLAITLLRSSPALQVQPPDGGYYLFPAVPAVQNEHRLVLRLLQHGVLVHPGAFYGSEIGTHLLISGLTEPSQLRAGIERLLRTLAE